LTIAVVSLVAFIVVEHSGQEPDVDLSLFRIPTFSAVWLSLSR